MQGEFAYLQSDNSTVDASTYTFSSENLGTPDPYRYIILTIESRKTGALTTITSVTIAGITAAIAVQQNVITSNTTVCGIAIAAVPTGSSGDIVVNFGATMVRCVINVYRATRLRSLTANDTKSSTDNAPTCNLGIQARGFAVGGALSATSTSATWTGLTEDYDAQVEANTMTSASASFTTTQTGLPITCTFASPTNTVGVFASWQFDEPTPTFVLDGLTIRAPSVFRELSDKLYVQQRPLTGSFNRKYYGDSKRTWELEYTNLKRVDYLNLKAIYDSYLSTGSTKPFVMTGSAYSGMVATNVHVDLIAIGYPNTGIHYLPSFKLVLKED